MKTLFNLAICAVAPLLAVSAIAATDSKESKESVIGGMFPESKLVSGSAVRVQLTDEIAAFHKRFDAAIAKMTPDQQKEMFKLLKPGQPLPFDERFGLTKDEYKQYIEAWKKKEIAEIAPIVVGFEKTSEPGVWKVAASSQQGPLPLATLRYDANKNVWISPNGTINLKGDVNYDELNNLGAWKGQEWLLESKDAFSQLAENILVGKTNDGKYVYIVYNMIEVTPDGRPTWNDSIVLRFPITGADGKDDLREKAKRTSSGKK